jgi:Zinc carboxypeptidase
MTRLPALGALLLAAPAAHADTSTLRVTVPEAKRQDCVTRPVTGAGVAHRSVTAPADGFVSARLDGPRAADWDLALIAHGDVLNAGAGPSADELADSRIRRGERVTLQVCRRSGGGSRATVRVRWVRSDLSPDGGDGYKLRLVRVPLDSADDRARLAELQLDTTDHPAPTYQDVLLHSAAEERRLRAAGFSFTVRVADVLRRDRVNRRTERRAGRSRVARAAAAAAIPSGRTSYRTLPVLEQEMKDLAAANPGLVRTFTLPLRSLEGRAIMGVEIAENVGAPPDGRPEYVMVGTHHAREWPANEATIEFALDLVQGYKSGNAELRAVVGGARTYLIPVLNVDGFNATIEAEGLNPGGSLENPVDTPGTSGDQAFGSGAYKRKTCSDWGNKEAEKTPCIARTYAGGTAFPDRGVDPNRNYGVAWGGPGSENDVPALTYHGPGPWSEVETDGFRTWLRDHHPAVLITNHTYSGLILRPPGTLDQAPVPDEAQLKALGDAMAAETGYLSQFSYQLYDTSGTTDDYVYGALGGFSYTPEIGKTEFHPAYTTGFIPEYDGAPGRGGLRRAFTLAGLAALNPTIRGTLQGTAPAGRTLRITRTLSYRTSAKPDDNGVLWPQQTIAEPRNTTLVVGADGRFGWAVNPSTQPKAPASPWTLTCEDGAGNVLERRDVYVARGEVVDLALSCSAVPSGPPPRAGCIRPAGFSKVGVARRPRGRLRIAFRRTSGAGKVTIEIRRRSSGRRIARMSGRTQSFTWNGRRRGRKVANGVYVVRFSVRDAAGRTDARRVVVRKTRGKFAKRGSVRPARRCVAP